MDPVKKTLKSSTSADAMRSSTATAQGGQRTDWAAFNIPVDTPLITIITSTFNAAQDLPWTIASIRQQSYPYIQWIVADGSSTDETVELLRQNEDIVDVWFSEPDNGIYDAWNKALRYARGDWVQFIGAGDELADIDTLAKVAPHLAVAHPTYDLVYGRLQTISEGNRVVLDEVGSPWDEMKGKWEYLRPRLPAHPSVFQHRSVMHGADTFDTSYKIAGDTHLMLQCIRHRDPLYIPILIDRMPVGGVSANLETNHRVAKEVVRSCKELGYRIPMGHFLMETAKLHVRRVLLAIFPLHVVHRIVDAGRKAVGKKPKWTL